MINKYDDVLILAHQDDELLGLHVVGNRTSSLLVVYLTDGIPLHSNNCIETRSEESTSFWSTTDLRPTLVQFGMNHGLKDGLLCNQFEYSHINELKSMVLDSGAKRLISLAFEGGHQDHDVTNLICRIIASDLKIELQTFTTYNSLGVWQLFSVMSGRNKQNGRIMHQRYIARRKLVKMFFRGVAAYRSQISTWLILSPFCLMRYLFGSLYVYSLESNQISKVVKKPDNCLYEKRGLFKSSEVLKFAENFGFTTSELRLK